MIAVSDEQRRVLVIQTPLSVQPVGQRNIAGQRQNSGQPVWTRDFEKIKPLVLCAARGAAAMIHPRKKSPLRSVDATCRAIHAPGITTFLFVV